MDIIKRQKFDELFDFLTSDDDLRPYYRKIENKEDKLFDSINILKIIPSKKIYMDNCHKLLCVEIYLYSINIEYHIYSLEINKNDCPNSIYFRPWGAFETKEDVKEAYLKLFRTITKSAYKK